MNRQDTHGAEGSGWAILTCNLQANRLLIMQLGKHTVNVIPGFRVLWAPDVREHT